MEIINQLREEFYSTTIDQLIRELARDIDQSSGVLSQTLFRAKILIAHELGTLYGSNMDVVKALLVQAADYHKKSGMFKPLNHGFASKCRECNSCRREKEYITGKPL